MKLSPEIVTELIERAIQARDGSYSPYSNFRVGAAILTKSGEIFSGSNVENASYGATICAERTAAVKAVSAGNFEFAAIAIVGWAADSPGQSRDYIYPCGICRQFLAEFADREMTVLLARSPDDFMTTSLAEIFPHAFSRGDLTVEPK